MNVLPITKLVPEVMSEVQSCPVGMVTRALNRALSEFCADSMFFDEPMAAPISTVAGTPEYALAPPAGYKVLAPTYLEYDGKALYVTTDHELTFNSPEWRSHSGTPYAFLMVSPSKIRLYPTPGAIGTVNGELALKPDRENMDIPEEVYDDYSDAIISGALARLMAMKDKEWFSAGAAEYHRGLFNDGVATAKIRKLKGFAGNTTASTAGTIGVSA